MDPANDRPFEILRRTSEPPQFGALDIPEQSMNTFLLAMGRYILTDAHGLWEDPADRGGHTPDGLAVTIGQRMHEFSAAHNGYQMESPIEGMLFAAMLWMDVDWAGMPKHYDLDIEILMSRRGLAGVDFYIWPQAEVCGYRADFLVWFRHGHATGGFIVECDGHEFHERTKDQAAHDRKRDRALLAEGFPVMRFTGSEVFRDPIGCAREISEHCGTVLGAVTDAGRTP